MIQTLPLPYTAPPILANHRLHWAKQARLVKDIRRSTGLAARSAKLRAVDAATVTLHWRPAVKRNRDDSGPAPTVKAAVDGLVDAGILPADTHDIVKHAVTIHEPNGEPAAVWLVIETRLR